MIVEQLTSPNKSKIKKAEFKALGFIILVLFPMLTVFSIGAYGFIIWMIQAFGGVVGH